MTAPDDSVVHAAGVCVSLGGMPVLRDVDIDVRPGELVALTGGNGSGKTTFVRALLGLTPHTHGDVDWFGTPLSSFGAWSRIGYVPQRGATSGANATVTELVTSGLLPTRRWFRPLGNEGRTAVADAIHRVQLDDRARWPMTKLSGGQQQRTLIARALVGRPEVLVLDEPMAGIDVRTQERLARLFGELKASGMALIVVLHERGALNGLIDHEVHLRDGRLA